MVSTSARAAAALWPPDDTEESIVGVDRHQLDIISIRTGVNEEAHTMAAGGPLPWQAISQIQLMGFRRADGSPYIVIPDIYIYPRPMDIHCGSYTLAEDGPPVLVVEVASESTVRKDLDLVQGKGWTYRDGGVAEYLVLDPTGRFVSELGRGWQLVGGVYQPWLPDGHGRWRSARLPLAIGVEDGLAAVYGASERRKLREGEVDAALAASRREIDAILAARKQEVGAALAASRREVEAARSVGRGEALATALRSLLRARFGDVPAALEVTIVTLDEPALTALFQRTLTASSLDDLYRR